MVVVRWVGENTEGYSLAEYFSLGYREYRGADCFGVYPLMYRVHEGGVEVFGGPQPTREVPEWVIAFLRGGER